MIHINLIHSQNIDMPNAKIIGLSITLALILMASSVNAGSLRKTTVKTIVLSSISTSSAPVVTSILDYAADQSGLTVGQTPVGVDIVPTVQPRVADLDPYAPFIVVTNNGELVVVQALDSYTEGGLNYYVVSDGNSGRVAFQGDLADEGFSGYPMYFSDPATGEVTGYVITSFFW